MNELWPHHSVLALCQASKRLSAEIMITQYELHDLSYHTDVPEDPNNV